ncbi:FtsX-like permease family protein [Micromonospora sp. U56]|uniref:FtsX-like permease family protein n=1 Tax=Micromonospora sp. U56 TaxID=2824900 RepID=UPI001B38B891|nr:FtsX-like permease family protein [Micromonospora sp. U56]MBQ0892672.1 FtsX-like permease family protein [Micromonospora sp. U56]
MVAIANTLVMAFSRRDREIASLILLGVTPGQVRRMVVVEALLVTGLGFGVAAMFLAIGLNGYHTALSHSLLATQVQLPWQELIGLGVACLVAATVTSLIAVSRILGRPAMAMVAARE